jgi:hypothetical protein
MAKGSKKYASHEYDMVKGGPALKEHKDKALELRKDSKTYPRKMWGGGTVNSATSPAPSTASSVGGRNLDKGGYTPNANTGSNLTGTASNFFSKMSGHAKGGEVKKKENAVKDIGDDNKAGSIYELGSSYKKGGKIAGKAKVKGDSPENDTKIIKVSPGEDVLPRSVTKAKNAPEKAKKFVEKLEKKEKKKK